MHFSWHLPGVAATVLTLCLALQQHIVHVQGKFRDGIPLVGGPPLLPLPEPLKPEDLIMVMPGTKSRLHLLRAHRVWTRGQVRMYIGVNMDDDRLKWLNEEGKKWKETYFFWPDNPAWDPAKGTLFSHTPGDNRAAMVPFLAHALVVAAGQTYKWMMYADDDTVMNWRALSYLFAGWDHTLPYWVSDHVQTKLCSNDGGICYPSWPHAGIATPRCLPCHYRPPWTPNSTVIGLQASDFIPRPPPPPWPPSPPPPTRRRSLAHADADAAAPATSDDHLSQSLVQGLPDPDAHTSGMSGSSSSGRKLSSAASSSAWDSKAASRWGLGLYEAPDGSVSGVNPQLQTMEMDAEVRRASRRLQQQGAPEEYAPQWEPPAACPCTRVQACAGAMRAFGDGGLQRGRIVYDLCRNKPQEAFVIARHFVLGGYGMFFSWGVFNSTPGLHNVDLPSKCIQQIRSTLRIFDDFHIGGDGILTGTMLMAGLAPTDPGIFVPTVRRMHRTWPKHPLKDPLHLHVPFAVGSSIGYPERWALAVLLGKCSVAAAHKEMVNRGLGEPKPRFPGEDGVDAPLLPKRRASRRSLSALDEEEGEEDLLLGDPASNATALEPEFDMEVVSAQLRRLHQGGDAGGLAGKGLSQEVLDRLARADKFAEEGMRDIHKYMYPALAPWINIHKQYSTSKAPDGRPMSQVQREKLIQVLLARPVTISPLTCLEALSRGALSVHYASRSNMFGTSAEVAERIAHVAAMMEVAWEMVTGEIQQMRAQGVQGV